MRLSYKIFADKACEADLMIPLPFPKDLTKSEYLGLVGLMDFQVRYRPDDETQTDGWFLCTIKEMAETVGVPSNTANRLLNELEATGYIKRRYRAGGERGVRRLLWVNFDKVMANHTPGHRGRRKLTTGSKK